MAKSFKDIMNTVPIDMTDPDEVTIRNPLGPSNSRGKGSSMVDLSDPDAVTLRNPLGKKATAARAAKTAKPKSEDMSKRITEKSNAGPNVKPSKPAKAKEDTYKMPKSTTADMDTTQGSRGSASGETGANMGQVNKSTSAPIEEKSWTSMNESEPETSSSSRFSSSNPLGMKKGGKVSSASRRADGCAIRGKTRA